MASYEPAGATPEVVAQHATQPDALDFSMLNLLGIFGPANDLRALVRMPGGKVRKVQTGQRLGWGKVVGIDESGVMIVKNGRTTRIDMPQG